MVEEDKGKASSSVKDASLMRTCSFLPASWAGDTHEETDFLPIGGREEEEQCLNRRTDSLEAMQVLMAKYFCRQRSRGKETGLLARDNVNENSRYNEPSIYRNLSANNLGLP